MDDKVLEMMKHLQEVAAQTMPQVFDMAVQTMYWQSLVYLVIGAVLVVLGVPLFIHAYRYLAKAWASNEVDVLFSDVVQIVLGIVGIVFVSWGATYLLNPELWMGVLVPKTALFYQIYNKVMTK